MRIFTECEMRVDAEDKAAPFECEDCPHFKECHKKFIDGLVKKHGIDLFNEESMYEFAQEISDADMTVLVALNKLPITSSIPEDMKFRKVVSIEVAKRYATMEYQPAEGVIIPPSDKAGIDKTDIQ